MTRTPAALVGIDLGTTNTVLAHADAGSEQVATFAIPQLVAPGEVGMAPLLPSSRYHPLEGELAADAEIILIVQDFPTAAAREALARTTDFLEAAPSVPA